MLSTTKVIIVNGHSVIDGIEAMAYSAQFDCSTPHNVSFNYYMSNNAVYKANREECRRDQTEFEEYVYALQDEALANIGGTEDGTEE